MTKKFTGFGSTISYIYGYYTSSADGTLVKSSARCTTGYIRGAYDIKLQDGFEVLNIVVYDLANNFLRKAYSIAEVSKDELFRISIGKIDNSNFTGTEKPVESIINILGSISYIYGYYTSSADGTFIKSPGRCTTGYINGDYDITLNEEYNIENIVAYDLAGNFVKKLNINDSKAGLLTRISFSKTNYSAFNGDEQPIKSLHLIIDNSFTRTYNLTDISNNAQVKFANVIIKKGYYIGIRAIGTGTWSRLLIGINDTNSDRLFDYMQNNTDYYYYCDKDINSLWVYVNGLTGDLSIELNVGLFALSKKQTIIDEGNILYSKKWAVCGDSFSNGDFTGLTDNNTITNGIYAGKNKVYGYLIGNRNNMVIQHMALGGRTLATPADLSFTNSFSYIQNQTANSNYTQIDEDADYATFYFGINDSHHRPGATGSDGEDQTGIIEVGTIDDNSNTTFYGAWNVMLEWLLVNRPFTKLGIIVSNGCETDEYRVATISIAKKWGIPYIDLNGDERTPMMLRSTNPNISSSAKAARLNSQRVSETNTHPNTKAHEYESTFIENFLRSL